MEKQLKSLLKTLKINENLISTVMGGVVVVIMAVMIFNYFKTFNRTGKITEESAVNLNQEDVQTGEVPTTYKVVKGDDLWHISERFYNSGYNYVDLVSENKLRNAEIIEVGQELIIPKVVAKKATVEIEDPKGITAETPTTKITIEGDKYLSVKGDYLWSIALRAYGDGYAWTKIYNANKKLIGSNPSVLFTGVELSLPR